MTFETIAVKTLTENLPESILFEVKPYKTMFGDDVLKIQIRSSDYLISGVRGQYTDVASWAFDLKTHKLTAQIYGGSGGIQLYRSIDPNNEAEKHYALQSEKIPFRAGKADTPEKLAKKLVKICQNYVKTLDKIVDMGLHRHSEHVAYVN